MPRTRTVTSRDATNYCGQLTTQERAAGRLPDAYEYRLPTEAQWEYACRAGMATAVAFGTTLSSTQANFYGDVPYNGGAKGPYLAATTIPGSYPPNAWGLFDMHGNVGEWCQDGYASRYAGGSVVDPEIVPIENHPMEALYRISRGGDWGAWGRECRSAKRGYAMLHLRGPASGFRVAIVPVR